MCGFSGFYDSNAAFLSRQDYYQSILTKMTSVLAHRGPDGSGTYLDNHCGLSHTRLSIIDLQKGSQPLSFQNCSIAYNGELYNMSDLRTDLEKHCQFQTNSDTEVVLHGLRIYGPDFIKELNGIFAFAFYDHETRSLILARDSFGVKPLFYTFQNDTLVFSSECKGLFAFPGVRPILKKQGLQELFGLGPARTVGCGIFDGIRECHPGQYLLFTPKLCSKIQYWQLKTQEHADSYEQTVEKTRSLLLSAIEKQMLSDVDICTFLSGGIDSSVVSAVCGRKLKELGQTLTTFSFDFQESNSYFKANDFQPALDLPFVRKMVAYLGSDHHELVCTNQIQADLLYDSIKAHDLPCMADVDSSLLYFCSQVAKSHKVVLTGECADELFGGYPWFHKPEFFKEGQFPWTPDLTPRLSVLSPSLKRELELPEYVRACCEKASSEIEPLQGESAIETQRRKISYLNLRYFMQTLLNRMDRTSMYSGLEARVPFCDRALVEYVFQVPWEMKAKDGLVKNLLRQSVRGLVPDEILFRKKSPYPKTYHPEYEAILKERLRTRLMDSTSPLQDLVDRNYLFSFLDAPKDYGKPWYGQLLAGPQMLAYLLQIDFWIREYRISLQ